jgi:hypothetical protein
VATKLLEVKLDSNDVVMKAIMATLTTLAITMETLKRIDMYTPPECLSGRGPSGGGGGGPPGGGGNGGGRAIGNYSAIGISTPMHESKAAPKGTGEGVDAPELPGMQMSMLCLNTPVEVRELPPQSHGNRCSRVRSMDTPSSTPHFCTGVRRADQMEVVFKVVSLPQGYMEREARMLLLAQV